MSKERVHEIVEQIIKKVERNVQCSISAYNSLVGFPTIAETVEAVLLTKLAAAEYSGKIDFKLDVQRAEGRVNTAIDHQMVIDRHHRGQIVKQRMAAEINDAIERITGQRSRSVA